MAVYSSPFEGYDYISRRSYFALSDIKSFHRWESGKGSVLSGDDNGRAAIYRYIEANAVAELDSFRVIGKDTERQEVFVIIREEHFAKEVWQTIKFMRGNRVPESLLALGRDQAEINEISRYYDAVAKARDESEASASLVFCEYDPEMPMFSERLHCEIGLPSDVFVHLFDCAVRKSVADVKIEIEWSWALSRNPYVSPFERSTLGVLDVGIHGNVSGVSWREALSI